MKHLNASVKVVVPAKKIIVRILENVFVRIISIADTPVITCNEKISVIDIVSTKMTKTKATTVSLNSDGK